MTMCIVPLLTGYLCPMCGMTRAYIAIMHGDVSTAFAMNPAWPLVMVLAVCGTWSIFWFIGSRRFSLKRRLKLSGVTQIAWWGYNISLYLVTLIGIVRNTPLWGTLPLPSWQ